ncbi:hypothetical protein FJR45_02085 [Sulfurimonas sediminis]|uniref:Indole-3-glycerol-phosphate synthase n=1 Tax=Sulfurimonas sediminis TaxID=2590020 RepID=A0A7M1AZC8_9BACT|nr:hypothetical protein [Sulfurimonas sediminis]QOP42803.1 hypothetical protein FJR45_02085 [Sulfurimonas sediminis]
MLLFGHRFIKSEKFYHVSDIDAIIQTPPASIIYLDFEEKNLDIIEYLSQNSIKFALKVQNVTELIYASALGAGYIHVEQKLAKTAQKIAENYLFDAKILVHIENEEEIEEMALLGIDGVVFTEAIVKIAS